MPQATIRCLAFLSQLRQASRPRADSVIPLLTYQYHLKLCTSSCPPIGAVRLELVRRAGKSKRGVTSLTSEEGHASGAIGLGSLARYL